MRYLISWMETCEMTGIAAAFIRVGFWSGGAKRLGPDQRGELPS
jgi:hypothetical protein